MALLSWPVARLLFRYRAYGMEHLPASGGYVLAAGHHSNLDPWPLGLALWPRRFLRFMAKSELFWFPLGYLITAGGGFSVRRGEGDLGAMQTAVDPAREGRGREGGAGEAGAGPGPRGPRRARAAGHPPARPRRDRGPRRPKEARAGARALRPACRARRPRGAAAGRGGTNGDRPRHGG